MDFRDRHIIVTGGTGALGRAVVGALVEAGAVCHVPCRTQTQAGNLASLAGPNLSLIEAGDLADETEVARVFAVPSRLWASIHLVGGFAFGSLMETSADDIRRQIDVNLITCLLCCRASVRAIAKTGEGGRIVNVAARPAIEWRQGVNMVAYTAGKAGVAALTVALAEEVVGQKILVNAVAPSVMNTAANRDAMPKADAGAWARVEDVARTILFLASPENRVTRGGVVPVYGGA
jgi:NAD(P)-dependent dehydrogenase (short-subunit alcohol dehydrogenase family)